MTDFREMSRGHVNDFHDVRRHATHVFSAGFSRVIDVSPASLAPGEDDAAPRFPSSRMTPGDNGRDAAISNAMFIAGRDDREAAIYTAMRIAEHDDHDAMTSPAP
jgi:hypothetical protein